jgi:hypothetical protein
MPAAVFRLELVSSLLFLCCCGPGFSSPAPSCRTGQRSTGSRFAVADGPFSEGAMSFFHLGMQGLLLFEVIRRPNLHGIVVSVRRAAMAFWSSALELARDEVDSKVMAATGDERKRGRRRRRRRISRLLCPRTAARLCWAASSGR